MNIHPPQEFEMAASQDAVFASLRAKLAGEVGSSAMLADLLEKLNGMQEAPSPAVNENAQHAHAAARSIWRPKSFSIRS